MTIYIDTQFIPVYSNNTDLTGDLIFTLTSGYAKVPEPFEAILVSQNARYSELAVDFGPDFKNKHKNGVYYFTISNTTTLFEEGYAKIICEPGGEINTLAFDPGVPTTDRWATVYYRPNY